MGLEEEEEEEEGKDLAKRLGNIAVRQCAHEAASDEAASMKLQVDMHEAPNTGYRLHLEALAKTLQHTTTCCNTQSWASYQASLAS